MKKAVITFGRFNPMTVGHEKLVNKVKDVSKKISGDPHIYLSHTQDKKRNPLDYKTKVKLAQRAFGSVVKKSRARTIIEIMKELEKKKYTDVHLVVGSDRVKEFDTLLQKYNGKDYTFDSIKVESAGDRDPDAEGVSGMSATKMRLAAKSDDLPRFKKGAPSKLTDKEIKLMYDKVQAVLEELENITIDDDIFQVSDIQIEAAINMDNYDDEDISDFDLHEKKPLTVAQRAKIARRMKKLAPKMKLKKALAMKKMATPAQLEKRAKKAAIKLLRKKFAGKAGENYQNLSPAQKISVDKIIAKKMGAVNKIAKKMLPAIRKKEQERIKSLRSMKEEKELNEIAPIIPAIAVAIKSTAVRAAISKAVTSVAKKVKDTSSSGVGVPQQKSTDSPERAKKSVKKVNKQKKAGRDSVFPALRSKKEEVQMNNNADEIFNEMMTTRYKGKIVANQIFKTQLKAFAFASKHGGKVIRTGKEFRVTVPRQSGPRSRTWDLDDNAKMSLMQKASRNDIPFEIIQEVFERGLEEYDITPRESQDRIQWGFARVNSFLTNGTRKAVDADLWEQAMDILPEGPNDPAIFKAVFLAGGPGSGKSFIAGKAGLRSFGFKLINPDPAFENALKKAGLEMSAKDIYSKEGQAVRKVARALTDKQTELAVHNRLGLLVDGTGKDYGKISKLKSMLDGKGYECFILAVNTDLETAIKRNRMRPRKLPDEKVKAMWMAVNDNLDKFKSLFGKNFMSVTNNDEDNPSVQSLKAYKKIGAWSKTPPKSKKAQNWIKAALDARKTRREEVEDNLNEVYVLVHNNKIVDKGNKSQMNSARKALKKKTGETDHKKLFVGLSGMKPQFVDIGKKWKEEVEIKEIYKGKEKVAVIKGKPNDIKQAKDKLDSSLDTMYNVLGPHDVSTTIDSIERYVDKLDRLIIKGTRAGAWAMNILKKNRKVKADYDFDLSSRKLGTSMMRMGEWANKDIQEAILKVDNFDDNKIRRIGRARVDLEQLGLKMKVQRGQGSEPGTDYAIFKGDEKNLVAYAQKWLGATGESLEDVQGALDGNTNLLAMGVSPDERFENLMEDQYTRVLDAIGKHLNHRAYMAALDVYKKKTVGKKDPHRSQTAAKIAQTFRGVEPKPFVDFINSLVDKGRLPREIHASIDEGSKAAAWAKGDADKNKLISLYNKAIDYPPHSPKWEKIMKEIGKLRKQMKLREDVQISLNDGAVSGDKKTRLIALYHKAFELEPKSPAFMAVQKEISKLRKKLNMKEEKMKTFKEHRELVKEFDFKKHYQKHGKDMDKYWPRIDKWLKDDGIKARYEKGKIYVPKKDARKTDKIVGFHQDKLWRWAMYDIIGEELDEASMDTKKRLQAFNKLKPNQEVEVSFDSAMKKGVTAKFKVGRKTKVSGGKIEKITMQRLGKDGKPGGVKHFLYNRGGNVSMAIGDLAATLVNIK